MPQQKYALDPGGPKRLTVSWSGIWKNFSIQLDGKPVGSIEGGTAELKQGKEFPLGDGTTLKVQLRTGLSNGLELLRNGTPLPGSFTDPAQQLKTACATIYCVAVISGGAGLIAICFHVEFLMKMGAGIGSVILAAIYGALGFLAYKKRSTFALGIAVSLYLIDGLLMLASGSTGIIMRALFLSQMYRGFGAIKALNENKPPAPAASTVSPAAADATLLIESPVPVPVPQSVSPLKNLGAMRAAAVGALVLIGIIGAGLRGRSPRKGAKARANSGTIKTSPIQPPPQASVQPKPASVGESPESTRKALEERYALGAKALVAQDLKTFLSLKTRNFQCKIPEAQKTQAPPPSLAPTLSAAFEISSIAVQGDQIVVDNVEKIAQNVLVSKNKSNAVRSEIQRRDTWVKVAGAWKLRQTEKLGFTRLPGMTAATVKAEAAKPAKIQTAPEDSEPEPETGPAPDEEIEDACVNEIGILCYSARGDIGAAKRCLRKYEGNWLAGCKKAMDGPAPLP